MALGLIGKKIGMSHMFSPDGDVIPVTVIRVGPCAVVQKKTREKDGYSALQLGFNEIKAQKLNKPDQGRFKHLDGKAFSILKEFRVDDTDGYDVGSELTVEMFESGETVSVSGTTKGRGFSGNIKRWGYHRGPMKHGSKFHRGVGGVSGSAYPGKVFRGKKMPGHYGNAWMKVKGLMVVDTQPEEHLILVSGAVPGGKNGLVIITKT